MSTLATHTEVICTDSSWTRLDPSPMVDRTSIEILNNDTTQNVGIVFTNDSTTPTINWNQGRIIIGGTSTKLIPLSGSVKIWARAQTGLQVSGASVILCEWGA